MEHKTSQSEDKGRGYTAFSLCKIYQKWLIYWGFDLFYDIIDISKKVAFQ